MCRCGVHSFVGVVSRSRSLRGGYNILSIGYWPRGVAGPDSLSPSFIIFCSDVGHCVWFCDLGGMGNTPEAEKKSSRRVKGVSRPFNTTWCDELTGRPHRLSRIVFKKRLLENRASFRRGDG